MYKLSKTGTTLLIKNLWTTLFRQYYACSDNVFYLSFTMQN